MKATNAENIIRASMPALVDFERTSKDKSYAAHHSRRVRSKAKVRPDAEVSVQGKRSLEVSCTKR